MCKSLSLSFIHDTENIGIVDISSLNKIFCFITQVPSCHGNVDIQIYEHFSSLLTSRMRLNLSFFDLHFHDYWATPSAEESRDVTERSRTATK